MAVRSGGLHRSLCPAFFSWAISVTEIHTESGAAFPTDHVHQTPARKHAPPTKDRATVHTIRNVHDVDDGARVSPTCGDDMLCVSTHDKQDPANGKRSSVQECDHFSPSARLGFLKHAHHGPEPAIRHGGRNDGLHGEKPTESFSSPCGMVVGTRFRYARTHAHTQDERAAGRTSHDQSMSAWTTRSRSAPSPCPAVPPTSTHPPPPPTNKT